MPGIQEIDMAASSPFLEAAAARGLAAERRSELVRKTAWGLTEALTGPATYEARPVRLGHFNGSRYQILAGVAVGEEVAVEGVFLLKSALLRPASDEE